MGVYTMAAKGKNISKVYCTKNELNIYQNAQYDYEPWILSGVVESKYLLAFLNRLKWNIALAFLATMILCILFVLKFADKMVAPINSFVDTIKKIRPDNLIRPEPTRIVEINELGTSIADLTEEISGFTKKTTAILSMTGISIGVFEYDPNSNLVFCTEDTFNMFGMMHKENELFMDKAMFNSRIIPLVKEIKPDIDIISPVKTGNDVKWLHIKTVESEGNIIGTIRDVTEEIIEKQQRDFERDHDPLTQFLNRKPFIDQLVRRFNVKAVPFAMLGVCKIPDLSSLNTRFGSLMGDKYIKSLSEVFGNMDMRVATLARTLGDEFAFMIEGRSVDDINTKFNALIDDMNSTSFKDEDIEVPHNIFVGTAWYPTDARTVEELMNYAEFAAQSVSETSGRNLVQQFSVEAYEKHINIQKKHEIIADMLDKYEINYAYQPIIDTSTGDIYGYEALMRPKAEGITPGDVMGYAASNDAFYAVERTTWINALKGFTEQVDSLSPKKVFINSIPNQLLVEEDIELLEERYGGYLDNVVLEILENEQTDDGFIEKKRALKDKWGCMLALDDFGSGYANENSLLNIKPDLIKLDLDLVANIDKDADRQSLVKNIVGYAHNRDIKVLAEGIETREQMNILLSLRVDLLQGFYLAKPNEVAVEAIDPKVKEELTSFDPNDMFTANVALRM
ncbi:MAG: EAL domain-containing protein [Firmicutes bacterium]|nr:EAL domain-containing protein [Bacillota bacterium]